MPIGSVDAAPLPPVAKPLLRTVLLVTVMLLADAPPPKPTSMPPPRCSRVRLAVTWMELTVPTSRMPSKVLLWPKVGRATSFSVTSDPVPPLCVRMPELFTVTKLLRTVALLPENSMP